MVTATYTGFFEEGRIDGICFWIEWRAMSGSCVVKFLLVSL